MITTGFYKRTLIGTNVSMVGSWSFSDSNTLQDTLDEWNNRPETQWRYEEITRDEHDARMNEKYPFAVDIVGDKLVFIPKE